MKSKLTRPKMSCLFPTQLLLWLLQIDAGGNDPAHATTVIWGTNINAESLRSKVSAFIWNFKDPETGQFKYVELIRKVRLDLHFSGDFDF
jgi:hypothetical protein